MNKTNKLIKQYAKKAISNNYDRYSHSLGIQPLREAIAKKYKKEMGINISEDQVIITTGSSAAIMLGLITSIDEGDEVLLVEPYYPCYPQLVKIFGGRIKLFTTHPEENFQINIKNLKKVITKKTKLIIINSPSNPTGVAQTGEVLRSIGQLGIKIISDEVYQGSHECKDEICCVENIFTCNPAGTDEFCGYAFGIYYDTTATCSGKIYFT